MQMSTKPRLGRLAAAAALVLASACGAASEQQPERLSASQHDAEAARHDRVAAQHQRLYEESRRQEGGADALRCYDTPVPDPTSGGEPIRVLRPCWTSEQGPGRFRRDEADEERREAARHRAVAATMRRAEQAACRGLGEDEISHSPFFHRDDILAVEEVRKDDALVGARVVFRKVPGLDAPWMNRALACHQARAAAMGYAPKLMSYCPIMVAPTSFAVTELSDRIIVTLSARGDQDIALVVGRALDLVRPGYTGPHH